MKESIEYYWNKRLDKCRESFTNNNFDIYITETTSTANNLIKETILPRLSFESISWGDSISMLSTGILNDIEKDDSVTIIKTFEQGIPREEIIERRRKALLVDLYFTGSNAITESGQLVNLDMVGNRVAALTFGPKNVIIVVGRNKIVKNVDEAMFRIKNYAAPVNAIRHTGFKTPCIKTSYCSDCISPDRICNTWTINEKSYPKGRIKIVLINEDLGL